ncbi:hypothetical protein C8R43DRAFT_968451 [Mycena crocata]|nr:hypothetical protein C8R43DRAFT_968451 [Mycena crocata]
MVQTVFLRMMVMASVAAQVRFVSAVPAVVTLLVPFQPDSPDPLTGAILGVGADGQTTYAISQNVPDGTTAVPATATLIEGSAHVSYGLTNGLAADCNLSGGAAVCVGAAGTDAPATKTINMNTLLLDVTNTAPGAGTTTGAGPGTTAPSAGGPNTSKTTSVASGSGTSASPPTPSKTGSSQKMSASVVGAVFMGVSLVYQLL